MPSSGFKEDAEKRDDQGEYWWELRACDYYQEFEKPKLIYQVFQVKPCFVYDQEGNYYTNNAIWILPTNDLFLLGLLNSKLGWFLISLYCTKIQNGYQLIFKYLGNIPIRQITHLNPTDKRTYVQIVTHVSRILDLHKHLAAARLPQDKDLIQRQIDATDNAIDTLVYDLYGLTDEEQRIIEEAVK